MTSVSSRYAKQLSLLLLPAVLLMWFQQYLRTPVDDCLNPGALFETQNIEGTEAEREFWEKHDGLRIQWSEGLIRVDAPETDPLRFRIVRSHNGKPLFRRPTDFLRDEFKVTGGELQHVSVAGSELPIHKLYGHDDRDIWFGSYLFVSDSRPIEDPYLRQLLTVVRQLVSGGHPLTLITVTGNVRGDRYEAVDRQATAWIGRAWQYYDSVCSPAGASGRRYADGP